MTLFLFFVSKMMRIVRTAASGVGSHKLPVCGAPPPNCIRRHIAQTAPVCTQHTSRDTWRLSMTPHINYTMLDNYWDRPNNNFVRIPSAVLQDSNLSLAAKGLYLVIAALAQIPNSEWLIHKNVIKATLPTNDKYKSAIKDLIDTGYLHRYQLLGQMFRYAYVLLETPIPPDSAGTPQCFRSISALQSYAQQTLGIRWDDGVQTHNYYHAPDSGYTKVPQQIIKDKQLHLSDKGMYGVLASRIFAPGWVADLEHDISKLSNTKEGYRPPMRRLEESGYLFSIKLTLNGRFCYCYILMGVPATLAVKIKESYTSLEEAQSDVYRALGITLSVSLRAKKLRKGQPRTDQPRVDQPRADHTRADCGPKKNNCNNIDDNNTHEEEDSSQSVASCIRSWADYRMDKYDDEDTNATYHLVVSTLISLLENDQNSQLFQALKDHLHFDREGVCDLGESVEELTEKIAQQMRNNDIRHKIPYIRMAILNHFGWTNTSM